MPSLYDQDSGNGVPFGANARKVAPSTRLGTRAIQRWTIYTKVDITQDYLEPNSLYSQIVRSIQQNVELYAVYMPGESFFNCDDYDYSFTIDAAVDTSVDLWTATNSNFGSEVHPMDWYWGGEGVGNDYNTNTAVIIDRVIEALNAAEVDNTCWVNPVYTIADMAWPLQPPGYAPPGAGQGVGNKAKADPTLVPQPGDTPQVLKQKRLKFIASLRGN